MGKPKSKLDRATENPLGAIGATRWLGLREFAALYRMDSSTVSRYLRDGLLQGTKIGNKYRIFNPGWEIMVAMRNRGGMLEHLPLFTKAQVAEILGVNPDRVRQWREARIMMGTRRGKNFYYTLAEIRTRIIARERYWLRKRGIRKNLVMDWALRRLQQRPPTEDASTS